MNEPEDNILLKRYVASADESAFRALVDRYIDLVYGIARRNSTNHHVAEEATQQVFLLLARKAPKLVSHPSVGGWLFRTSTYVAKKAMRDEIGRQSHTKHSEEINAMLYEGNGEPGPDISTESIQLLDEALNRLSARERDLVLMRFYRGLTFRQIGRQLDISENAGQKRLARVVNKLARMMRRNGGSISGAAVGGVLVAVLSNGPSAPAGLAKMVSGHAMTSIASLASMSGKGLAHPIFWHMKVAGLVAIAAASAPLGQYWLSAKLWPERLGSGDAGKSETRFAQHPPMEADRLRDDPFFGGALGPAERMRRILELENQDRRRAEIRFLAGELPLDELPAALGVLADRAPEDVDHLEAFIDSWVSRDPHSAIAFVKTRPAAFQKTYWHALIKGWVRVKPDEAWEYVSRQPADTAGENLVDSFIEELSYTDGAKAISLLASIPDRLRSHHLDQVFHNWPAGNLDQAMEAIGRLPQDSWIGSALESLLESSCVQQRGASFLLEVEKHFGVGRARTLEAKFYSAWFRADTVAAIAHVRSIGDPDAKSRAAHAMVTGSRAYSHHREQLEFMDEFGGLSSNGRFVIASWIMHDPEEATAFVAGLPAGKQGPFTATLGAYFAQRHPDRAVEWSRHILDPEARNVFLTHLLRETAKHDFETALALMDEVPDQQPIADAITDLTEAYAQRDPQQAMAWAIEHSPDERLAEAASRAMRWWAKTDISSASEWLALQEPGIVRDTITAELVNVLRESRDYPDAIDWALSVDGAETRRAAIENVLENWAKSDAASLRTWVDTQPSEVRREALSDNAGLAWLIGVETYVQD